MNIPPELIIAGIAGAAVLMLVLGFASKPAPDAVQQRLSQLVAQPKTLEEIELQAPFFERTLRPMVKRLADLGGVPMGGSPADFGKVIVDETEKWRKVVEFAGVKLD